MFGSKIPRGRTHSWSGHVFKGVKRVNVKPILIGDRVRDAQLHEMNREDKVANFLTQLYFMAARKIIPPGDYPITAFKALRQNVSSTGRNQAAHLMPCQILINGSEPSEYLLNPGFTGGDISLERYFLAASIRGAFGATDDLPRNYNLVDSLLEIYGLREAFVKASDFVLREGLLVPESPKLDPEVILHGFHIYKTSVRDPTNENETPFELAYTKLSNDINAPGKNPEDTQAKLEILEAYGKTAEEYEPQVLTEQGMKIFQQMLDDIE